MRVSTKHIGNGQGVPRLPFVRSWGEPGTPLPLRDIRAPARRTGSSVDGALRWETGPADQPFDFCAQMHRLCLDISRRCRVLAHLDLSRILFAVTQARNGRSHGLQARVTPLRFHAGRLRRKRRGVTYQVQQFFVEGRDILYVIAFCLPRFLDLDFDEKFVTLFHELFHINPAFDGDLRRHNGRYCIHSHSQRRYDQHMGHLAREYLSDGADPSLHAFLRLNFAQLEERHGAVLGVVVPRPKIIPVLDGEDGY